MLRGGDRNRHRTNVDSTTGVAAGVKRAIEVNRPCLISVL